MQPIDHAALEVVMRGVIGIVATEPPIEGRDDLFELAERLASATSESLWMQRLRLRNTGQ